MSSGRPQNRFRNPSAASKHSDKDQQQQKEQKQEMHPSKAQVRAQKRVLEQQLRRQIKDQERLKQHQPKARFSLHDFDPEGDVDPIEAQAIAARLGEDKLPELGLDASQRAESLVQRLENWWFRGGSTSSS